MRIQRLLLELEVNAKVRAPLAEFRKRAAELRAIPLHLRRLLDASDEEHDEIDGLEDAQLAFYRSEHARLDVLQKPMTVLVPAFPRGKRGAIIKFVQRRGRRRFGRHFNENEIESCWALICAVEDDDDNGL